MEIFFAYIINNNSLKNLHLYLNDTSLLLMLVYLLEKISININNKILIFLTLV